MDKQSSVDKKTLKNMLDVQRRHIERRTWISNIVRDEIKSLKEKIPESIKLSRPSNIPLVLVLPFPRQSFKEQLSLIDLGNGPAYTYLNPRDLVDIPKRRSTKPYLIFDVEPGKDTLGISPNDCPDILKRRGRFPTNMSQTLALIFHHPEIFKNHNVMVSGSRIKGEDKSKMFAVDLYIFARKVKMKRENPEDADPRWGSPSYSSETVDR
jgi:hypothetical protein